MKTMLSFIRWKFVIPVGIFLAAVIVFFVLFFDPLLERALESVGSRINGARVEIAGLKTKFARGRLSIERLQITNKKQPMENLLEAGPLAFQMNPFELLKKKVVINESTLNGLIFNSPRQTSGALPRLARRQEAEDPGPAERLYEKYKDRFEVNLEGLAGDVKQKIEFDRDDLTIVKESRALQERATTAPKEWDERIDKLDVEGRLDKAEADLKAIRETPTSGPEAIRAIPESLKKLKQVKEDLDRLKKDVTATRDSTLEDTRSLKAGASALTTAKQRDMDNLLSRFNLDFADPEKLMQAIVGPMVLERFQTVMGYIQLARKHMPSQKEKEAAEKRPRSEGIDVEFPTPAALPRFWLMKGGVAGRFQDVNFDGNLAHLTSDPVRVGKPFTVALKGAKAAQVFTANVVMDHTGPSATDSIGFKATGLDFVQASAGTPLGGALEKGAGSAEMTFTLIGEDRIGGAVEFQVSGMELNQDKLMAGLGLAVGSEETPESIQANFVGDVVNAIEALPVLAVEGRLTGSWQDPGLSLTSNLTSILAGVIKNSVGNLVRDQRAQLEGRLNAVLAEERKKVDGKIADATRGINDRLAALETEVQGKIQEATGINLGKGGVLPGIKNPLDKLFNR